MCGRGLGSSVVWRCSLEDKRSSLLSDCTLHLNRELILRATSFGPVFDLWHHPHPNPPPPQKKIKQEASLKELDKKNIRITDQGDGQLAIEVIGSGAAGKLFTGNVRRLDRVLVAVETAWMGDYGDSSEKKEARNSCCHDHCSLDTHSLSLSNLRVPERLHGKVP